MTTDAELYSALKYRVVDDFGTRSYHNAAGEKSGTVMGYATVMLDLQLKLRMGTGNGGTMGNHTCQWARY